MLSLFQGSLLFGETFLSMKVNLLLNFMEQRNVEVVILRSIMFNSLNFFSTNIFISMKPHFLFSCAFLLLVFFPKEGFSQKSFETIKVFPAEEAIQGVAVDSGYFYAIGSRSIGKYEKKSGRLVKRWEEEEEGPIRHLDSGIVVDGKLYAAHSNYPEIPMTSSVEIWESHSLTHVESHSFGIQRGSLTWLDRHEGYWWGVFAHYKEFEEDIHKDNRWTSLVQFNDQWQPLQSWVFPKEVLDKFGTMSNSGGSWGPDGMLYISGHDLPELYVMKLPEAGSVLRLISTVQVNSEGQGIAWDRSKPGNLFTIKRSSGKVVISEKL